MDKTQENRLIVARKALEDIYFNGNLHKYKLTPNEAHNAVVTFNRICKGETAETFQEGVKNFFVERNFTVKQCGISWKISL